MKLIGLIESGQETDKMNGIYEVESIKICQNTT